MRHGLLGALVIGPLALGAIGCNNGPEPIDFGDLTTRVGAAFCSVTTRCGTQSTIELLLGSSVTNCGAQTATYFANTQFARFQEAIDQGTIVYDADQAATCIASFEALSCDPGALAGSPAGCDLTFVGTVADGSGCSLDEECLTGSTCVGAGASCGTCTRTPAIGQTCTASCVSGAYCNGGTCAAQIASGGSCTAAASCASGTTCQSGTCQAPTLAAAGQPCGSGCQTGLVCAVSGTTRTCRAARTDGSCQLTTSGSDCTAGTTCNATLMMDGTCVAYPALGAPCTTACAAPARCVARVCHGGLQLGEACTDSNDCISGVCDGTTCQAPPLCSP